VPGPVYVPGATNTSRPPPPKPVTKPWISAPSLPNADAAAIPQDVTQAWRSLWHALGSNLPWYINHSRASRRTLRQLGRTHG
jgi:hypothetical protein